MRNLKRVLSLALALVMVLGMMVITTSAADFTDAEEITYTEAVDVISALGVINGFEAADGTFYFDGDATLTREQGAAFVCYLLMGKTNADKLVGAGTFTDVAADRWSAGEIDYCYNLGLIKGNPDGTFNPEGPLTSVAFGRMLLGALGYDGDIEGYTGGNWATNIASDIIDAGLDVKGVAMDAQLTREQAAQMAFQALEAEMVRYTDKGTDITMSDGTTIKVGASDATKVVTDAAGYASGGAGSDDYKYQQFCEKYFPNLLLNNTTAFDAMGRPANEWTYMALPVGTYAMAPAFTTVAKAKMPMLSAPSGADVIDTISKSLDDSLATVHVNGGADVTTAASIEIGSDVEVFLNYNGTVNRLVVTDYTAATVLANTATKTDKGVDYISISGVTPGYVKAETVKGETDLAKFDVVLYYKDTDDVYTIEKAESVMGAVSGIHSKNGLQVGEGYYLTSANVLGGTTAHGAWDDFTNTYKFYLDHAGRYVKAVQITDDLADNYVVVTDIAWVQTQGIEGGYHLEARIVKADGSNEIVKIASVDDVTPVASAKPGTTKVYGVAAGTNGGTTSGADWKLGDNSTVLTTGKTYVYGYEAVTGGYEITAEQFIVSAEADLTATSGITTLAAADTFYLNNAGTTPYITVGSIYSYDLDKDGNYELSTSVVGTDKNFTTVSSTIKAPGAQANVGAPVNDSTVFVYATKAGPAVKYTAYTGYANIPAASSVATIARTIVVGRDGFAKLVYVDVTGGSVAGNYDADLVYVADNAKLAKKVANQTVYVYDGLIINGVPGSMTLSNSSLTKGAMYVVTASNASTGAKTLVDIGNVGSADDGFVDTDAAQTGISANGGNTIVIGSKTYTYDADTIAYYINEDDEAIQIAADAIALDVTDSVYVVTDKVATTKAVKIYVVEESDEPSTLVVTETGSDTPTVTNSGNLYANGGVDVTSATLGTTKLTVTTAADANMTYTVAIKGNSNGTTAVSASAAKGASAAVEYTTVAANIATGITADTAITITVTAIDGFSGLQYVYTYTVDIA